MIEIDEIINVFVIYVLKFIKNLVLRVFIIEKIIFFLVFVWDDEC